MPKKRNDRRSRYPVRVWLLASTVTCQFELVFCELWVEYGAVWLHKACNFAVESPVIDLIDPDVSIVLGMTELVSLIPF